MPALPIVRLEPGRFMPGRFIVVCEGPAAGAHEEGRPWVSFLPTSSRDVFYVPDRPPASAARGYLCCTLASLTRSRKMVTDASKSPVLVQRAMGHADLATTMGYTHLLDEDVLAFVDGHRQPALPGPLDT